MINATDTGDRLNTSGELLQYGTQRLSQTSATPRLDSELIICAVLDISRTYLFAWPDNTVSSEQKESIQKLFERRANHEPIAYLTGSQEFWSRPYIVTPDTLIPRPETELLIEIALRIIPEEAFRIADLGTGSGIIAVTLKLERPAATVFACDISPQAIQIAKLNAVSNQAQGVNFWNGCWMDALKSGRLDLIISNPPYISRHETDLCSPETRYEPELALFADNDGTSAIRAIAEQAQLQLNPGGWLLLEHGFNQASKVADILLELGYKDITTEKDLTPHSRATYARTP